MEFGKSKDAGMVDYIKKVLKFLKGKETTCKFLRCDNAGEHGGLKNCVKSLD